MQGKNICSRSWTRISFFKLGIDFNIYKILFHMLCCSAALNKLSRPHEKVVVFVGCGTHHFISEKLRCNLYEVN